MSPLDESALVEAMTDDRCQVGFLRQFSVILSIAPFTPLLISHHAVEGPERDRDVLRRAGVAAFEWINGEALQNAYLLLDVMQEQYRWSFGQTDRFPLAIYEHFVLASCATRTTMALVTHASSLAVILLAFLSRPFIQSRG